MTSRTTALLAALSFAGLSVVADAQAPLLQVATKPEALPHRGLVLRNHYRAPATEWVLRSCPPDSLSEGLYCLHGAVRHRWALPALGHDQPIPAGGERVISGGPGAGLVDVAVIYADGATAGDPLIIKELLTARQRTLDDLRQVIPILQAAAANPDESPQSLEATLSARNQQYRAAVKADYHTLGGVGPAPTYADRVCAPLIQDLKMSVQRGYTPKQMSVRYAQLATFLTSWVRQFEASKPALH